LRPLLEQYEWTSISAKERKGVDELLSKVVGKLKNLPPKEEEKVSTGVRGAKMASRTSESAAHPPHSAAAAVVNRVEDRSEITPLDSPDGRDEDEMDFDKSPLA
jgi:hypothetical protein